jgi:mannobiose 2-epimerase
MRLFPFAGLLWGTRSTWQPRISTSVPIDDVSVALGKARSALTAILQENLLPFWVERIPRTASGTPVFLAEERDGSRVLNLILMSRYLWFVSALAASAYGNDVHVELANQSYRVLRERLHDSEHGGFVWETNLDTGASRKPGKHLYGQAFAIYALSQYGKATGNGEAIELANATFALLETHAHDAEFGGYDECFERNWQPAQGRGYLGWEAGLKSVNAHLHVLEALTGLFEVAPGALLENRIIELIEVLSVRSISRRFGVALDGHHENWAPLRGRRNRHVSYGHEVEAIHLLAHASATIGSGDARLAEHFRRRFAYCMEFGFDFEGGGFFDHGPLGRRATSETKIWWVQAEALLSALTMYRLTLQRHYLGVFAKTLEWIDRVQVDWQAGEWHRHIDPRGQPSGAKVDSWKGPYHNGRAVLASLGLIDELFG